ncbi:MAG: family 10 glycosylhydrolase [Ruminococcus sp.]|nr:family 10 glycosylhydrolase [Ruminococcus sp.]
MKVKEIVPIVVSFILFGLSVAFSVLTPPKSEEPALQVAATAEEAKPGQEMRGVWITYMELSMENEDNQSESAFREKFAHMAYTCKKLGFNTLVVQVRPFADALYSSDLYPASHVLTGIQGEAAGYDALKVMCEICGNFGMYIQAWVNPYRVTVNNVPNELCDDNIFVKHPEWCIETDSGIILDPSNADARQLIEDGVLEIAESYDIDGVQFDDYFYPADIGEADYPEYMEYLDSHPSSGLSLERWRELNVNILLSEIYLQLQNCGRNVVFGISPQGNFDNNANLSADVVSWCCIKGFADYICPQLYFSLDNPKLGFEQAAQDWCDLPLAEGVQLYAGLAGYKAGTDADEGTWLEKNDILKTEYNILKKKNEFSGFMLYSYSSLENADAAEEIKNLCNELKSD